ncbi:hypothetical protein ACFW3N_30050, partial [Streptomyces sp. NPDC058834]|uniref:hypothetical protein n=1 Tax=Streptomyces sp. NPDC058834 TaxID=3346647 RepID=UPI0036C65BA8
RVRGARRGPRPPPRPPRARGPPPRPPPPPPPPPAPGEGDGRRRRRGGPRGRAVRLPAGVPARGPGRRRPRPGGAPEWERIDQLLAGAVPGTVYDPDADVVVQAGLAAADAAAAAREAELREAARIAARADKLQALRGLETLEQTGPRTGDEAVRDELTRRAGGYIQADVDAWLAHALAAHLGHYREPAAREGAAGLLTPPVLAHAALLAELARLVPDADVDQLAFAARLAVTEPEAVGALAAFLARAWMSRL